MYPPDEMGRDEGDELGPKPGKGAVVHQLNGEEDFDGLPGDELPPKKKLSRDDSEAERVIPHKLATDD
jgi:hypothetical protein